VTFGSAASRRQLLDGRAATECLFVSTATGNNLFYLHRDTVPDRNLSENVRKI